MGKDMASPLSRGYKAFKPRYYLPSILTSAGLGCHTHNGTDFQPVVELVEMEHAFDENQDALKAGLREKLRLLLPSTVDDQYCNFLVTQIDLVFETHRVNMTRECLARCQIGEQRSVPRQPNRRSRRSTLLQGLQRNTPDAPGGVSTRRHTRTFSTKHAGLRHAEPNVDLRKAAAERRSSTRPASIITAQTVDVDKPCSKGNNPRDSRDSGIGIPCDNCNEELCNCPISKALPSPSSPCFSSSSSSTAVSNINSIGSPHIPYRDRNENLAKAPRPENYSPSPEQEPHHHRHHQQQQPRLSLMTCGLDGMMAVDHGDGLGPGMVEGRYSPESFKQRVLRKQARDG